MAYSKDGVELKDSQSGRQLDSLLQLVINACLNNIMYWRQGGHLSKKRVSGDDSSIMYHASEVERSLDMASKALMHKNNTIEMLQAKLEEIRNSERMEKVTNLSTKEGEAQMDVRNDFLIEARRIAASPSSSSGSSKQNSSSEHVADGISQLQIVAEGVGVTSKSNVGIDTTGLVLKLSETMQELHEYKARVNRQKEEIRELKEELDRIRAPNDQTNKVVVHRTADISTTKMSTEMEKQLAEKDATIAELAQLVASREAAQIALVETVQEFLQQQSMPSTPRCSSSQDNVPKLEEQIDYWQGRLQNQAEEAVDRLRRGES